MADSVMASWSTSEAIETFVAAFENASLPRRHWTHRAHLLVALASVQRWGHDQALVHLRERIRAYNEATGTSNGNSYGYHETLTRWFLQAVAAHQARHQELPLTESLEVLLASPLGDPGCPLAAYSPERLWSVEARHGWVEPDLRPGAGPAAIAAQVAAREMRSVPMADRPVLYSFRRCPYAIRARLALAAAGLQPGRDLELREVNLKAKPPELLEASVKGTVPVLVLPAEGRVIDQSLDVMRWALKDRDAAEAIPGSDTPRQAAQRALIEALIASNDGPFKHHLDRFKYADRYPGADAEEHRAKALAILREWNQQLQHLEDRTSLADLALLPFVRQFRLADPEGFDASAGLTVLRAWLERFLASPELATVMAPPWAARTAWHSPSFLYHFALAEDWRAARSQGSYRRSSRGQSLEEVGFIHASHAAQLQATHQRFYADANNVLLLTIDPQRLAAAGIAVEEEPAPGSGEFFPHIQGPLPLEAVLAWEPYPS